MSAARRLNINWSDLEEAYQFASDEITYYLNLETGKVVMNAPDSDNFDVDESDQIEIGIGTQFIKIPHDNSRDGYEDMQAFIETVRNPHLRENLDIAIQGKGAFRRFKDVLARSQNLTERERWFQFQQERVRERIRRWLEDEEIEVIDQDGDTI